MKSLVQLQRRKAWLETQLVKVEAEIKARTPKKKRRAASGEAGSPGRSAGADDPGSPDNNDDE